MPLQGVSTFRLHGQPDILRVIFFKLHFSANTLVVNFFNPVIDEKSTIDSQKYFPFLATLFYPSCH
jgi:hypothetical protein